MEMVTYIRRLHDVKFGQVATRCQSMVKTCCRDVVGLFRGHTVKDHATSTTPPSMHDGCDQNNLVCAGSMMVCANNPWASGDRSQSGFVGDATVQVPLSDPCRYYLLDDE